MRKTAQDFVGEWQSNIAVNVKAAKCNKGEM